MHYFHLGTFFILIFLHIMLYQTNLKIGGVFMYLPIIRHKQHAHGINQRSLTVIAKCSTLQAGIINISLLSLILQS